MEETTLKYALRRVTRDALKDQHMMSLLTSQRNYYKQVKNGSRGTWNPEEEELIEYYMDRLVYIDAGLRLTCNMYPDNLWYEIGGQVIYSDVLVDVVYELMDAFDHNLPPITTMKNLARCIYDSYTGDIDHIRDFDSLYYPWRD